MELLQVQVFFRHGARTPLHYLTSTRLNKALWTSDMCEDLQHTLFPYCLIDLISRCPINITRESTLHTSKFSGGVHRGELIQDGQADSFELGKRLRIRYAENQQFISKQFNPSQCYTRSTFIKRTIKSLRCVLAGLFENNSNAVADIECLQLNQEFLFPNTHTCSDLVAFYKEGLDEAAISKPHLEMKSIIKKYLNIDHMHDEVSETSSQDDCPIYYFRDDIVARMRAGFPVPQWASDLLVNIDSLSCEELLWEMIGRREKWNQNVHKVIGQIFRFILANVLYHDKLPKFHLYACHDSTLLLLLFGLQAYDAHWPPFSADLIFEFYRYHHPQSDDAGKRQTDSCKTSNKDELILHINNISKQFPFNVAKDQWSNLWFRLVYQGNPIPLRNIVTLTGTHKMAFPDGSDENNYYLPLSFLFSLLSDSLGK